MRRTERLVSGFCPPKALFSIEADPVRTKRGVDEETESTRSFTARATLGTSWASSMIAGVGRDATHAKGFSRASRRVSSSVRVS